MLNAEKYTILIVDDSPLNTTLLNQALKQQKFQTLIATNGVEALQMVEEHACDLLLLDIIMPEMDGYECLRRLRASGKTKEIPVIFLTALNDTDAKVKGLNLGANDFVSKPFNVSELLARVSTQIRLKEMNLQIKQQHEVLLKELEAARKIQQALLPEHFPSVKRVHFGAKYIPSERVGGDLYDVFPIDEKHIGFYICDVSGHGVSAAMITVFVKQRITTNIQEMKESLSPSKILGLVNESLVAEHFQDLYATIFFGILNVETLEMCWSSAAHHATPALVHADGTSEWLHAESVAVGWFPDMVYPEEKLMLKPGDRLTLYTDGIIEARNKENEFYGLERTLDVIRKYKNDSIDKFATVLCYEVARFSKRLNQEDDIALLAFDVE